MLELKHAVIFSDHYSNKFQSRESLAADTEQSVLSNLIKGMVNWDTFSWSHVGKRISKLGKASSIALRWSD